MASIKDAIFFIQNKKQQMKKVFFCLFFFQLVLSYNFAQEKLLEIPVHLKGNILSSVEHREVVNIKGSDGKLALFLIDRNEINAVLIDKNLKTEKILNFPEPKSPAHKNTLGGIYSKGNYIIFYSSKGEKLFGTFSVNFESGKQEVNVVNLELKKEVYIESLEMNGKFYIVSIMKHSSLINVYEFTSAKNFIKIPYNFQDKGLPTNEYENLYSFINTNDGGFPTQGHWKIQKIFLGTINGLDATHVSDKIYYFDNKIIFTSDKSRNATFIMVMDLNTRQPSFKTVRQGNPSEDYKKTNSFLFYDKLFQGAVNDEFVLKISDWKNNNTLKTFNFGRDDSISFKNSPIIQEGTQYGGNDAVKVLSKTKQIIRKMGSSTVAIDVNQVDSLYKITIGSYLEWTQMRGGGGMMMGAPGYGGTYVPTYNPIYSSYGSRTHTKSAYFKSLLDAKTFEHRKGSIAKTVFDKMESFEKRIKEVAVAETIFKIDNDFIYGYYDKEVKKYILMKF